MEVNEVNPGLIYLKFEVIDTHGCDGVSLGEVERKAGVWISKKERNKQNNTSNGDILKNVTSGTIVLFQSHEQEIISIDTNLNMKFKKQKKRKTKIILFLFCSKDE